MKITKRKIKPGEYVVLADGRGTRLSIVKDDRPKRWGNPQEWDVLRLTEGFDADTWLFTAKGLEDAHRTLQILANSFQGDFT